MVIIVLGSVEGLMIAIGIFTGLDRSSVKELGADPPHVPVKMPATVNQIIGIIVLTHPTTSGISPVYGR